MSLGHSKFMSPPPVADDPDAALMLRVQADEAGAFAELIDLHWGRIFGKFLQQLGDRQEAEDLVQDVFLRIYRNRKRYRPRAKFATWLYHIARNVAKNAIRTQQRRRIKPLSSWGGYDGPLSFDGIGVADVTSRLLDRAETAAIVRKAVSELKGRRRQAVELQCRDHSYSEIADALRMTPKAAKSLLYRARNELRESLRPFLDSIR